uniref:Uncharacterized protein n=1 Tax=Anopheles darlingi TaxID=43151 RepID=A0A2M4D5F7_ANODA
MPCLSPTGGWPFGRAGSSAFAAVLGTIFEATSSAADTVLPIALCPTTNRLQLKFDFARSGLNRKGFSTFRNFLGLGMFWWVLIAVFHVGWF